MRHYKARTVLRGGRLHVEHRLVGSNQLAALRVVNGKRVIVHGGGAIASAGPPVTGRQRGAFQADGGISQLAPDPAIGGAAGRARKGRALSKIGAALSKPAALRPQSAVGGALSRIQEALRQPSRTIRF